MADVVNIELNIRLAEEDSNFRVYMKTVLNGKKLQEDVFIESLNKCDNSVDAMNILAEVVRCKILPRAEQVLKNHNKSFGA